MKSISFSIFAVVIVASPGRASANIDAFIWFDGASARGVPGRESIRLQSTSPQFEIRGYSSTVRLRLFANSPDTPAAEVNAKVIGTTADQVSAAPIAVLALISGQTTLDSNGVEPVSHWRSR